MFKIINEKDSSQVTINDSRELLTFFENKLHGMNAFERSMAKSTKKYIEIIKQDFDKWFSALDTLASISGNGGFKLSELQKALLDMHEAFFHIN